MFSGQADWPLLARLKETVAIPVIGSGDLFEAEDCRRMLFETGCDGVMIARGALGNPWIFRQTLELLQGGAPAPVTPHARAITAEEHLQLQIAALGDAVGVREMKKHLGWYIHGVPGPPVCGAPSITHRRPNSCGRYWRNWHRTEQTQAVSNERNEYYATVLDSVGDGVIVIGRQGQVTLMNPAAEELTGRSRRQTLELPFADAFNSEPLLVEMVVRTAASGVSRSDQDNVVLKSAGRLIPVNASTVPLLQADGEAIGVILTLRDLTSIRELEAAVRQADRLSTLGTLAAGLAHEVKNPLGGIKGAAQLLERELDPDSDLQEYPRVMIRETERIDKIIRQLLELASSRGPRYAPVNLHMVLGDIILLQREAAGSREVSIVTGFDPSIPPIMADEAQLTQVFLNLIRNALEAMTEGGRLTVTSRVLSEYQLGRDEGRSRMVAVEVADTGPGITPENLPKVGTPFFSTKEGGTGLGLAICQKIVAEHRGMLKIDSQPGQGTRISVLLPLIQSPAKG
jgi:two-component system nitrogen regulation sensor histidine kinase GlnL